MAEPEGAGAAAWPGAGAAAAGAGVILTPDQRVRVFISSTLEELAAERAAARRAIARLHLVPVFYESGARPHPPRAMYRAYLAHSQVLQILKPPNGYRTSAQGRRSRSVT